MIKDIRISLLGWTLSVKMVKIKMQLAFDQNLTQKYVKD